MKPAPTFLSRHRLARLTVWARLMLMWMAQTFLSDARHSRTRRDPILDAFVRFAGDLIFLRAADECRLASRPKLGARFFATPGFRQKRLRVSRRAAYGSWLHKALRHRDPRRRIAMLLHALMHAEAYAARLKPRLMRRLTRLRPRIVARPPAAPLRSLATFAPSAADSS